MTYLSQVVESKPQQQQQHKEDIKKAIQTGEVLVLYNTRRYSSDLEQIFKKLFVSRKIGEAGTGFVK